MTVLIVVAVVTILISFLCSLYEAILYSTRMSTLEVEKSEGKMKSKAQKMISMKNRISIPISAILILNTVAHTAGATIAGMYAAKALGDAMVPAFSVVFTLAVLFLSEILPKTVGAVYWRSLWPTIVWPLTIMKYALYPFIILTQKFSESLTDGGNTAPHVTEAEILGTIRMGARDGEISQWESLMLHNIIRLENKAVEEIMTPRTVMFTLNEDMDLEKAFRLANEKGFSRIPVYRGDRENFVGYVMLNDLISARMLNEPGTKISSITKPIMFVREDQNCLVLLTSFLKKRLHIAMIGDDYGGVAGLVTLEDLIETILGAEIVDETDDVVDLQKMARKRMQKRFYLEKELEGSETDRGSFGTENTAKQDALIKNEKGKEEYPDSKTSTASEVLPDRKNDQDQSGSEYRKNDQESDNGSKKQEPGQDTKNG
ncbi:MAG: hemolysin family protein [Desulfococcaceae bacterium]